MGLPTDPITAFIGGKRAFRVNQQYAEVRATVDRN